MRAKKKRTHNAGREDKDERSVRRRVLHDLLHVQDGWLHKLRAQVVDDEGGHAELDSVGAQRTHDHHALQLVARVVPLT